MTAISADDALDAFISRYLESCSPPGGELPLIEFDPEWPSPCYVGEPGPDGLCRWRPVRRAGAVEMFDRLADAIGAPVHPDLRAWYERYWSDPLPARTDRGDLSLLFVWNDADYERLRGNLIGHLLDCRRHGRPDSLFFACTEPEDLVISVNNRTGEVLLEQPGTRKYEVLASRLADFAATLEPRI